jgi:hypothetical protein
VSQPTTPRDALIDLADRLAGEAIHTVDDAVEFIREVAEEYPDDPDGDLIRLAALQAASRAWAGVSAIDDRNGRMLSTARAFEAYLRGDV